MIEYILAMVKVREREGQGFHMEAVSAHDGDQGNDAADALAKAGRFLLEVPERDWNRLIREQYQILELMG